MKKPRIGIVGLLQESNTFIDGLTRLQHFKEDLYLHGEDIRKEMVGAPHEVGGFFERLEAGEFEAVPLFLARALPFGVIEAATFDQLMSEVLKAIDGAGPLDGILAAPHGATVAENHRDADGAWLSRVREKIGREIPLIATIDPHANLSQLMLDSTDAIIAYSTNPHLDQRETGIAAADLMCRTVRGEIVPVQAASFPDLAINIQCQNTSAEPLAEFYDFAESLAEPQRTLSHSIVLGFPYADVPEMGSAVIVVTDAGVEFAETKAGLIGMEMWGRREQFAPEFLAVEDAVRKANEADEGPVVLLDMGDNVGGGSRGNSNAIGLEWMEEGEGRAFVCLHDPDMAAKSFSAGVGVSFAGTVGDPELPIAGNFRVVSLHDGKFKESEARHGGFSEFDQGATAVLEVEVKNLTLMVTERRMAPFSLSQLTTFGIDPSGFRMIVAKGVIAPMAAYAPVADGGFLQVDSPGETRADMTKLAYRHRRRPMFPFERE